MNMREFLTFRKMITPSFIQVIFWIGVAVCVIYGLVAIVSGASSPFGGSTLVLAGVFMILLGPLFIRIWCELLIVLFRMNDTLTEIGEHLQRGSPSKEA